MLSRSGLSKESSPEPCVQVRTPQGAFLYACSYGLSTGFVKG